MWPFESPRIAGGITRIIFFDTFAAKAAVPTWAELFYSKCLRCYVGKIGWAHFERYFAVFFACIFGKESIYGYIVTLCGAADRSCAFVFFNPEPAAGKDGEVGAQGNVIRVGRCYCPAAGNVARLDVYGIYDVVRGSRNLVGIAIQLSDSEEEEFFVGYPMLISPEKFDFGIE